MTLQRSLTKRNPKPQSQFQNYILRLTISELHSEIKTLKTELQTLKQAQQKDSAILQHLLSKIER